MLLGIASLPDIWHQLVEFLSPADLGQISQVSSFFPPNTERYLYRRIKWTWNHSRPDDAAPIHQLLLNILRRRELALHVRELHLEEIGYGKRPRLVPAEKLSFEERGLLRYAVQQVGLAETEEWIERAHRLEGETIVALLIVQLRRLRKLTINMFHRDSGYDSPMPNWTPVGDVLRAICGPSTSTEEMAAGSTKEKSTAFAHLEEFYYPSDDFDCHDELMRRGELADMLPVLRAPRLRRVSLKLHCPESLPTGSVPSYQPWMPTRACPPHHLTVVSLPFTTVAETLLPHLLSCMNQLQVFRLTLLRDLEAPVFNGSLIRKALWPCRKVLQRLSIKWNACETAPPPQDLSFPMRPLGCLREFSALSHIDATISALVGDNGDISLDGVLPPALESLVLGQEPYRFDKPWEEGLGMVFDEFLPSVERCTPRLHKVQFRLWEPSEEDDAIRQDMVRRCQECCSIKASFCTF